MSSAKLPAAGIWRHSVASRSEISARIRALPGLAPEDRAVAIRSITVELWPELRKEAHFARGHNRDVEDTAQELALAAIEVLHEIGSGRMQARDFPVQLVLTAARSAALRTAQKQHPVSGTKTLQIRLNKLRRFADAYISEENHSATPTELRDAFNAMATARLADARKQGAIVSLAEAGIALSSYRV